MLFKKVLCNAIVAACAVTPLFLVAQEINDFSLEEIVVTGARRATTLSDTSMSISALSAEVMREMEAENFKDYIRTIPGVNFAEGVAPGEQEMVIRGVNFPSNRFQQSTVSVYLDEISLTQNGRNPDIDLIDMQRIEILRGPQGTLYGSSSMGGTVRYISNKANVKKMESDVKVGIEDTEEGGLGYSASGMVNIPLKSDKLALRAVAYYKDLDGWMDTVGWAESNSGLSNAIIDSSLAEDDVNTEETLGGRIALRWYAIEDLTVDFMYLHHDTEVNGLFDFNPFWGEYVQQRRFDEKYSDELDTYGLTLTYEAEMGVFMWTTSIMERDYLRISDPSRERIGLAWWFGDFSDAYSYGCDCFNDALGNFAGHAVNDRPINWELETHEFRFSGKIGSAQLIAGTYFSKASNRWKQTENYPGITESPGTLVPFAYPDFFLGTSYADAASTTDFIVEPSGFSGQDTDSNGSVDIFQYEPVLYANLPSEAGFFSDRKESIEQLSVYGNLIYDVGDAWELTIGLRWFDVEIDNDILLAGPIAGTAALLAADELLETPLGARRTELVQSILDSAANNYQSLTNRKSDESGTQVLVSVSYDLTDEAIVYLTYAEGFRVGGVNRAIPRRDGSVIPVDFGSDQLDSFELGWKSNWIDNTLQFNGAAFYIEWEDIQIGLTDDVTQFVYVENAGEAEIVGSEWELRWLLTERLDFSLGATFIDHEITKGSDKGAELPLVSNENFSISTRYEFDLVNDISMYLRGDWTYTGGYQTDPNPNRPRIASYEVLNLRIGLVGENWEAGFFAKNVFNDDAPTNAERPGNSAPMGRLTQLKPRTIGINYSMSF